jgi:hypothetical protein
MRDALIGAERQFGQQVREVRVIQPDAQNSLAGLHKLVG